VTALVVHLEILPAVQRTVLTRLGPIATELGFYLAGGTAVALRLGHRTSVDLDWFADVEQLDPHALAATLRARLPEISVDETGAGALHATLDGVRLTFLRYRYPLLEPLEDAGAFRIAALADLVCMKLAAATQRGEKKDFFDIAAICEGGFDLAAALELYRRKFSLASSGHVLLSLTYFDDADGDPDPRSADGPTWPEVKRRLVDRVRELSRP
jgi:hypothetical protein